MKIITIGGSSLCACTECQGIWADAETLQQIFAEREKQAAVLAISAPPAEPAGVEKNIQYLPCPVCRKLMNRVNFAHCSNVVLDVCKAHGTWFEKDELRRTIEFIRAGGLEKARAHQIAEMEDERKRLEAARSAPIVYDAEELSGSNRHAKGEIFVDLADLIRSLFG